MYTTLEYKEPACKAEDLSSTPGLGRSPGNCKGYSFLENPHGQRNLAGYSPWGLYWATASDTAEPLTLAVSCVNEVAIGKLLCNAGSPAQGPALTWRGWDRVGGREVQEWGDTCMLIAESPHCVVEPDTALGSNYPPIKNNWEPECIGLFSEGWGFWNFIKFEQFLGLQVRIHWLWAGN